jgi:CRISPR-associated protein Csb1
MTQRLLLDVPLAPSIGTRFQPTGFPDLGHADFERPVRTAAGETVWERSLLVESAQSMANRLEGTAWDSAAQQPVGLFAGLPYIRVVAASDGRYLTSSRTEAHRLASAFVKDSTLGSVSMVEVIRDRLGMRTDTPLEHREIAAAVFALDPFCLIHGVFFADNKWPGQPKIARALTGFIEASNVRRADSGGVKRDHVRHSIGEGSTAPSGLPRRSPHRLRSTDARFAATD